MSFVTENLSRWANRVALVTGASAGIGATVSKNLVKHGIIVIGCARRLEQIERLAEECRLLDFSGQLIPYRCDLSNESEIEAMFAWIIATHKGIDVCVNTAGVGIDIPLLDCCGSDMKEMLDINVIALVLCTKYSVKSMMDRNVTDGHIFNINCMLGHRLTGWYNFNASTKFAVTAITEGFRRELVEKTRIRITAISPGVVRSEFLFRSYDEGTAKEMISKMPHLEAQDIADTLLFCLSTPESVQIHDVLIRPSGAKI